MNQIGFFDESKRLATLSKLGDRLEWLNKVMDWRIFEGTLERVRPDKTKRGVGGRPPFSNGLLFKVVILQALYNISDDQMEFQINDRLSWQRFLGLSLGEKVPDSTTIWLFRELLTTSGAYDELFELFNEKLLKIGVITREGSIEDATFVDVPKQRNKKEENQAIKAHETPEGWEDEPHKLAQKDLDARWAKKGAETHFGYKNHVKIDKVSKMITKWRVTAANVNDIEMMLALLDEHDRELWADSGYTKAAYVELLKKHYPDLKLHINEKAEKGRPLTEEQKANNREKSRVRVRVEHVFGHMAMSMGGLTLRCIGIARAESHIVLRNLAYNLSRYSTLRRLDRAKALA
jgi:IS5 family transposase